MAKKSTETEVAKEAQEFASKVAEIREIENVRASVPSAASNREELIAEQMIVRAEETAPEPPRYECDVDGAKFTTKEAAELHLRSFHPEAPKGASRPPVPFAMPVQVVKDEDTKPKAASIGKATPDDES